MEKLEKLANHYNKFLDSLNGEEIKSIVNKIDARKGILDNATNEMIYKFFEPLKMEIAKNIFSSVSQYSDIIDKVDVQLNLRLRNTEPIELTIKVDPEVEVVLEDGSNEDNKE